MSVIIFSDIQGRIRWKSNICWQNSFDVTSARRFVPLLTINKFEKAFYAAVYLLARKLVFDEALNISLRITHDADDDDIKALLRKRVCSWMEILSFAVGSGLNNSTSKVSGFWITDEEDK